MISPECNNFLSAMPWFKKLFYNFNRLKWFLVVACFTTFLQEIIRTYFINSAPIWQQEYGFSKQIADWFIILNEYSQILFIILLVYLSGKLKRIVWTGFFLLLLTVSNLVLLIIDYIYPHLPKTVTFLEQYEDRQLCHVSGDENSSDTNVPKNCWYTYCIICIFQFFMGVSMGLLKINSILYIDDHKLCQKSVIFIGILLSFKYLGSNFGTYLAWITISTQKIYLFASNAWLATTCLLIIFSSLLITFPLHLNNIVILRDILRRAAAIRTTKLLPILHRVVANKIVMLNVFYTVFMWSAINNFERMEYEYIKFKFFMTNQQIFPYGSISEIFVSILQMVLVFITIIVSSLIISKFCVRVKMIAVWNTFVAILLGLILLTHLFISCERKTNFKFYYNEDCSCDKAVFDPVCLDVENNNNREIYFSPCHATCTQAMVINGMRTFSNCSALSKFGVLEIYQATRGECFELECENKWFIMQVLRVLFFTLASSTIVGQIVLNIYGVHYIDRGVLLAFEATVVSFTTYVPVKFIYMKLAEITCGEFYPNSCNCKFHNDNFAILLIVTTVTFLFGAAINSFFCFWHLNKLNVQGINYYKDHNAQKMSRASSFNNSIQEQQTSNNHRFNQQDAFDEIEMMPLEPPPNRSGLKRSKTQHFTDVEIVFERETSI